MAIVDLQIQHFRNLSQVKLAPLTVGANIIQGTNGSGKTSLLEAIHFLGLGKSFRSHIINRVIQYDAESFSVFAKVMGEDEQLCAVGIERGRKGLSRMRIDGSDVPSSSKLAEVIPLQLLEPHSFELLEGGPALRRSFIDWGVFHVEHNFLNQWKSYNRAVKQRNMALKMRASYDEVLSWNNELIEYGVFLDVARKHYLEGFSAVFETVLPTLIDIPHLSMHYYSGWTPEKTYESALLDSYSRDQVLGYTQFGPHHADFKIQVNKLPAKEVLSRGQQKLFVCAMKIAQGLLYKQVRGKSCIYLLDDLVAELDVANQAKVFDLLGQQDSQIFITCTDDQEIVKKVSALPVKAFTMAEGALEPLVFA